MLIKSHIAANTSSLRDKKVVFLDRDGVINSDLGYVHKPDQIEWLPGLFEFCFKAQNADFGLIVVTNQSGIARGYFSEDTFLYLTRWLHREFQKRGVVLSSTWYCPHHPEFGDNLKNPTCACRNPLPGLLLAAARHHQLDLSNSIMIGDKASDIIAGQAAGVTKNYLIDEHSFEEVARLNEF